MSLMIFIRGHKENFCQLINKMLSNTYLSDNASSNFPMDQGVGQYRYLTNDCQFQRIRLRE